jgi:hypothetical protein
MRGSTRTVGEPPVAETRVVLYSTQPTDSYLHETRAFSILTGIRQYFHDAAQYYGRCANERVSEWAEAETIELKWLGRDLNPHVLSDTGF